jgi:anthranilate phosphoribosyltransferase
VDYKEVIRKLVEDGTDLARLEARQVVDAILNREFSDLQIAAALVALSRKGETADEVAGAVDAILSRSTFLRTGFDDAVDIGGTGGDRAGTFNISTTAAFIVAAVGVPVVKHGNRSVTSTCGSSDMIAALGVDIERSSTPEQIRADLGSCNFAFVATSSFHRFAPRIGEIRREIGVRRVSPCRVEDLAGGDPERNAQICTAIIEGERGPRSDAAVIAASALLVLSGKANSFMDGASMARSAIDSGKAHQVFQSFLGQGL